MPALEVLEPESFHVKFPDAFVGNGLEPVLGIYGNAASRAVAAGTQGAQIAAGGIVLAFAALSFSAYEILLRKAQRLRHTYVVDVQRK